MAARIVDGRAAAAEIRARVAQEAAVFRRETGKKPGLAVVVIGENPASGVYVRMKERSCAEVGILVEKHQLPREIAQEDLLRLVERLNDREDIHGVLIQLPLPGHISEQAVTEAIQPAKDVDGLHPLNAGRLCTGREGIVPCISAGIMELIRHTGVKLRGRNAVVVGRSPIVGKPTALLLMREDAVVTVCSSQTPGLAAECRRADVLVVAAGKPAMVGKEFIKPGAVVIDVGVNELPDGGLVGDVEFDEALETAGYVTPVPGGVGPMAIAMLLHNTVRSASSQMSE